MLIASSKLISDGQHVADIRQKHRKMNCMQNYQVLLVYDVASMRILVHRCYCRPQRNFKKQTNQPIRHTIGSNRPLSGGTMKRFHLSFSPRIIGAAPADFIKVQLGSSSAVCRTRNHPRTRHRFFSRDGDDVEERALERQSGNLISTRGNGRAPC